MFFLSATVRRAPCSVRRLSARTALSHAAQTSTPHHSTHLNRRSFATATTALKHAQIASQLTHPDVCHRNVNAETPDVFSFFEKTTATWQYILVDPHTLEAAVIDSVLDYNPASGEILTATADGLLAFIEERQLHVTRIL